MKELQTSHVKWLEKQLGEIETKIRTIEKERIYLTQMIEAASSGLGDRPSTSASTKKASLLDSQEEVVRDPKDLKFPAFANMSTLEAIHQCLLEATEPLSPADLTQQIYNCETNKEFLKAKNSLSGELYRGERAGKVKNLGRGKWIAANTTDISEPAPSNEKVEPADITPGCFEDVLEESVEEMATELEAEIQNGQVGSDYAIATHWQ